MFTIHTKRLRKLQERYVDPIINLIDIEVFQAILKQNSLLKTLKLYRVGSFTVGPSINKDLSMNAFRIYQCSQY